MGGTPGDPVAGKRQTTPGIEMSLIAGRCGPPAGCPRSRRNQDIQPDYGWSTVGSRRLAPGAAGDDAPSCARTSYWPHVQSTQVQFAQVQFGLSQLRAVSPQLQSTQLHGSQVHAGFSQVVGVVMSGSLLSSAHLVMTGGAASAWHRGTPVATACATMQSPSVPVAGSGPGSPHDRLPPFTRLKLIPWRDSLNTLPRFTQYHYRVFLVLRDMLVAPYSTCGFLAIRKV